MLAQYWANVQTLTTLKQNRMNVSISWEVRCRFQRTMTSDDGAGVCDTHTPLSQDQCDLHNNWFPLHYNVTFLHLCWDCILFKKIFFNSTYFLIIPIQFLKKLIPIPIPIHDIRIGIRSNSRSIPELNLGLLGIDPGSRQVSQTHNCEYNCRKTSNFIVEKQTIFTRFSIDILTLLWPSDDLAMTLG